MLIINKQCRAGEKAQQWKAISGLPHCVYQFLTYTWGPTTTYYFKIKSSEAIL